MKVVEGGDGEGVREGEIKSPLYVFNACLSSLHCLIPSHFTSFSILTFPIPLLYHLLPIPLSHHHLHFSHTPTISSPPTTTSSTWGREEWQNIMGEGAVNILADYYYKEQYLHLSKSSILWMANNSCQKETSPQKWVGQRITNHKTKSTCLGWCVDLVKWSPKPSTYGLPPTCCVLISTTGHFTHSHP